MELKSRRHTVSDLGGALELCYTNGWTDGLPVVPPTAERIHAMLEAAGLEPQRQLAFIENRQVSVTAEKVAINAVMSFAAYAPHPFSNRLSATPEDEHAMYALVEAPQDFLVIAAGGRAGVQSAIIPGWGSKRGSRSVTREIRRP